MKILILFVLPLFLVLNACSKDENAVNQWKGEILETERKFAELAQEEGIARAFESYAAEDAVLMRNNTLIIGKNDLVRHFEKQGPQNHIILTWKPEFVDVSSSGDLGYTYGYYQVSITDSTGSVSENSGVFHTVWKRQEDGTWKFVWD